LGQRWGSAGERRYSFVHGDIRDAELVSSLLAGTATGERTGAQLTRADAILHLAAERLVDRSILGPSNPS
jgi:dTDP-D-glucose 4,6-dehydratase